MTAPLCFTPGTAPADAAPRTATVRGGLFMRLTHLLLRLAVPVLSGQPFFCAAQTLHLSNDIQTHPVLTNTAVTLTGRAELRLTGAADPLPGCTVHLNSEEAWLIFTQIRPSAVRDDFLARIRVNGAAAVLDGNVRIVQFGQGAVVIPHDPAFRPLEIFDDRYFRGPSWKLAQYGNYDTASLGERAARISSFKLKRGYMATFATSDDGVSNSRCYIAQDGDIEVGRMLPALDNSIRHVRVFPWRWVGKKGSCDVWPADLNADWHYNWNIDRNSALDWEYVAIKQQPYWPGTNQDWRARGVNHLSGFNEPDNPVEDAWENLNPRGSVSDAVARTGELVGTGLRVGAPAVTDGGSNWITSYINQADAAGLRVDYVPVHYYRSHASNNPAGAASALYNFLKSIHDVARRPVWVTEFNNGANWTDNAHDPTTAENRDVIAAMIEMMDATPWIERYAIYSDVEWFRDTHYAEGGLTPMGARYRDHVAPIGHRQERRDSEISRTTRYRFDGDTHDSGGAGQDPVVVGTPSFAAGKYGQALLFDGVHDYLQVPSNVGDSTNFTFAAWVFWNGGGNWQRIFDLGDLPGVNLFLTTKAGSSGGTRFAIAGGGGEQRLDAATFPTGVWTHVAVTISGDTGKLFINGAVADTNTAMTFNPGDLGVKYNYLGRSRYAADPNFNGRMDDVRFVSSALSDAEIAALVAAAPPSFGSSTLATAMANVYQPYSATLAGLATGGTGPLTYDKTDGPAWLRVAADGTLSGTPAAADVGGNRFMVRVTDAAFGTHMAELSIQVQTPGAPVPVTISASIASSSHDAEQEEDGTVTLTSTDLEMTDDTANGAGMQTVGLRFSIPVPPGAFISDARIQFTADEDQSEATDLTIATEAADSAAAFTTAANSISTRARHAITVPWQPAAWTAGQAGAAQQTPNLAGLVQPVVSRAGWQSGNAIAFIITGTGHRTADAFDKSGGVPARLTITYYTPSPLFSVVSTINSSANDAEESSTGAVDLVSTDLEMVADGARGNQIVGLRFTPLAVPRDAVIASAFVQFAADEAQSAATALTIRAQAADHAGAFTAAAADLSSRALTTASIAWSPPAWNTAAERSALQRTPDLADAVQEVVARPGWASGNALALLISGTGQRTADAFDDSNAQPAQLTVNYHTEVPQFTCARWSADFPDLGPADADDDGDGAPNFMEYAFGTHPQQTDSAAAAQLARAGAQLHFTWQHPAAALEASYQPEWADSLSGPWSAAGVATEVIADDGVWRTLGATLPAGSGRRFVRLRVSLN